jgi:MFS family permease
MKIFQKDELKLLGIFYLEALVSSIFVFFPAFMIIYFVNIGLSFFQISLITTILLLFRFLFEIPTGAIADVFGRKFSVLLGLLIAGITFFFLLFFDSFYSLMIIFAILGFAGTFESGARESWAVDLIKREKKNNLQQHYFIKLDSIASFGLVLSGLIGALVVKNFGLSSIWFFAGIACLISFFLLGFEKEHFVKRKVKIKDSFKDLTKQSKVSINYARHHKVLFLFLIATAFIVFANEFNGSLAWVPFLQNLGFPEHAFGYLWSAMGVMGIFAPFVSLKFLKKGKERKFILTAILLTILFLTLVIFVKSILFAFLIILSQLFFSGMSRPVERSYFHKFIKSKLRATVGSVESMLIGLVALIAMPLAGLSIDYFGARYTILLSALLMIPSAIIFFKIKDGK